MSHWQYEYYCFIFITGPLDLSGADCRQTWVSATRTATMKTTLQLALSFSPFLEHPQIPLLAMPFEWILAPFCHCWQQNWHSINLLVYRKRQWNHIAESRICVCQCQGYSPLSAEVKEDLYDVLVVTDLLTCWLPAIKGSQQALVHTPTGQKIIPCCGTGVPLGTHAHTRHTGEVRHTWTNLRQQEAVRFACLYVHTHTHDTEYIAVHLMTLSHNTF